MKNKHSKGWISYLIGLVILGVLYYFWLPPVNLKSVSFWLFCIVGFLVLTSSALLAQGIKFKYEIKKWNAAKVFSILTICTTALLVIVLLLDSSLFHAKAYSKILTVQEGDVDQLPTVEGKESIALMDTASAEKLGNREIGSLSGVVSQYEVGSYTQIDYQGNPVKVAPLVYADFFKWTKNKTNGVPGYVIVNPVDMSADYIAMDKGMRYVPSAYFQKDLTRHIRMHYPTAMFDTLHFEIDEEGNPKYVASIYTHEIGLFGGKQVKGAFIIDPVDGEIEKYDVSEVPTWADEVFDGNLICKQYNDSAQLQNGFWNSIFGQVGSRKITEYVSDDDDESSYSDYGYIAKDGDIWIYTGVTSLNNDSSNIGFIMANERTEETIFINCAGADEFSAMASAEGEVQEKGYHASFPSLILIDGKPTYIMVLKDDAGLVKMYAAVNVQQYNIVATAASQEDCIRKYDALINGKQIVEEDEKQAVDTSTYEIKKITVKKMHEIVENGNTYLYIVDDENNMYSAKYTDVLDMLMVSEGDEIEIQTDGTHFLYEE